MEITKSHCTFPGFFVSGWPFTPSQQEAGMRKKQFCFLFGNLKDKQMDRQIKIGIKIRKPRKINDIRNRTTKVKAFAFSERQ